MPKWLFWLALFFVLFLIYTQPTNAGNIAGNFADFAVQLLDSLGEFLTGLFDGASGGDVDRSSSSGGGDPAVADGDGSFTHFHDGRTHTHND